MGDASERVETLRVQTQRWVDSVLGRRSTRRFAWFAAGSVGGVLATLAALFVYGAYLHRRAE